MNPTRGWLDQAAPSVYTYVTGSECYHPTLALHTSYAVKCAEVVAENRGSVSTLLPMYLT